MNEFRADLHCHSTCSDGTSSPEEIIRMASEIGLTGLSITDHDTIKAYESALPLARQLNLELIPGVEFSASQDDISVHILAYSFPLGSSIIEDFCLKHSQRRAVRNREILIRLAEHGMPLSEEEVMNVVPHSSHDTHSTVGRPHIALAMLNKGYIQSIQEGFNRFLGEGKSCYSAGESFSVQETINTIHQAKGLAVIAHPHLIMQSSILNQLLNMNFDGIECYYARFPAEAQARWLKIAKQKGWLITGGSDYHGAIKPNIMLGASWVNEEHFRPLQKHYQEVC